MSEHPAISGAKAIGRATTSATQTAHSQLEILPQAPSWAGYWTFVTATIILMFILYTAQKGTLSTWVGFFAWSNPATPTAPNAGAAPTTSQAATAGAAVGAAATGGTGTGAALGATTGVAATTLQGIANAWSAPFTSFMNALGIPYGGAFSGSPSGGTAGQQ